MTAIYDYNQGIANFKKFCPSMGFNTIVKVLYCGIGSTSTVCFPYTFTLSLLMLKLQEENIDLIELLVGVCCIKNNAASTRAILIYLQKRKERFSRYIRLTYKALKTNYWQLTDL